MNMNPNTGDKLNGHGQGGGESTRSRSNGGKRR